MRLRRNFLSGTISVDLSAGGSTITSPGFVNLGAVTAPDYMAITLDVEGAGGNPEIVWITAHTAGSANVTATRGCEGTAARSHLAATGEVWHHAPTVVDFSGGPIFVGRDFGAQFDASDESAILANALDAVAAGEGQGELVIEGPLTVSGTPTLPECADRAIRFAPSGQLRPMDGAALKIDENCERIDIHKPNIWLPDGSTASRGIWAWRAIRTRIHNLTLYTDDAITIPSGFVGVHADDNAYWTEIYAPRVRKFSGAVTGCFDAFAKFSNQSNGGVVAGGNVAHCDAGISADGCNGLRAYGTAYENVGDCLRLEPAANNMGLMFFGNRGENLGDVINPSMPFLAGSGYIINLLQTTAITNGSGEIQACLNFLLGGRDKYNNPNILPLWVDVLGGISEDYNLKLMSSNGGVPGLGDVILFNSGGMRMRIGDLIGSTDGHSAVEITTDNGGISLQELKLAAAAGGYRHVLVDG